MSIATVVLRGYGSFGDINFVPTRGYGAGGAVIVTDEPSAVIRRRWHGYLLWDGQEEWEREREALQAQVKIEYESLIDQRALLRDELRHTPNLPTLRKAQSQLQRRMAALNREIKKVQARMDQERKAAEKARELEAEDMRVITLILEELDLYG